LPHIYAASLDCVSGDNKMMGIGLLKNNLVIHHLVEILFSISEFS